MRILYLFTVLLIASCGTPQGDQPTSVTATASAPVPATASFTTAAVRERDYLDALRNASVPLSRTGESEIAIGRAVCAGVAKGEDPESFADDLRRDVPVWTSDNVTAVIRTALAMLC